MSRVYDESDYHGVVDDNYRWYPFFAQRAEIIDDLFRDDYRNQITVVAGSGWGFLIEELSDRQWNQVYGLDASPYAVHTASNRELPTSASRVLEGDILSASDLQGFRSDVGRPWFVITEDVLPCAANIAEAETMLDNLRGFKRPPGDMCHIITPRDQTGVLQADGSVAYPWGGQVQMPGFLWLSTQEWLDLIGPGEPVMFTGSSEWVNTT